MHFMKPSWENVSATVHVINAEIKLTSNRRGEFRKASPDDARRTA